MREILHDELISEGGGHPLFEVRGLMEIEYEVACRDKQDLVLMHVEVDGLARIAKTPERERAVFQALIAELRAMPRTGDLLGYKDGARIVVLLSRTKIEAGEQTARTWIERARKLVVAGEKPVRASVGVGIATLRHDQELDFETLVHVADDGLSVALNSGGESCVHTELYGLYQKKIERERPPGWKKKALPLPPPPASSGTLVPHKPKDASFGTTQSRTPTPPSSSAATPVIPAQRASMPAPADLEARVRETLSESVQGAPSVESLEAKLKSLAQQWAEEALRQSLAAQAREHERTTDLLERRIAKLSKTLESTEEELRALASTRETDPGVPSAYRGVQGLDAREHLYDAKRALLSQILEANLELHRRLRTAQ